MESMVQTGRITAPRNRWRPPKFSFLKLSRIQSKRIENLSDDHRRFGGCAIAAIDE
jgi:hypothetical protein